MKRQLSNRRGVKNPGVKRGCIWFIRRSLPMLAILSATLPFFIQHPIQLDSDISSASIQELKRNPKIRGTDLRSKSDTATKPNHKKLIVSNSTVQAWSNDRQIVHVIYSRFMQHQPDLLELGQARLRLFKTICLPTVVQQTNQQFLWIIRTDPDLEDSLKENLLEELRDVPNVVVVGSNKIKKGSINDGFRGENAIDDITSDSLFLGNMALVQSYHENAQKNTVLETNLDADDGLGLNFVETAQKMTETKCRGSKRKTAWFNLCVGRHLEWQYYAPWDNATDKGSLHMGSKHICITAGLSWATMVKAEPEFTEAHHLIKQETKDCNNVKRQHLGCWAELPEHDLLAIRARTPTSTGMAHVLTSGSEWTQDQIDIDKSYWPMLSTSFGISQDDIKQSHHYLTEHMESLVGDNLRGQCQEDHSCSEGIKKKLKKIIYKDRMWKNKHDVVHVIQTSVDSLLSAYVLQQFSFSSLEAQTSYEFLWIIRVKEVSDSEELDDFLTDKLVGKSALNILVVKSDHTSSVSFRTPQAIVDITEETLLYGEMEVLQAFHEAAQNRTMLETALEPYDALGKTFVEEMQSSTVTHLVKGQVMDNKNVWYYRCMYKFIEWNYFTPEGYDSAEGFLSLGGSSEIQCSENPGVTRISRPGSDIPYFDPGQISECQLLVVLQIKSGCYVPMFSNETLTARALIPESVEKPVPRHVETTDLELLDEDNKHLRSVLRDSLNIYPSAVETMRNYIQKTQCSDSRTCNVEWDSEHGVTHVIQTSLKDDSSFLYWRYFCLSIEAQTSNKFLWIIRVNLDSVLMEKLLKIIRNIDMNVIVVKSTFNPDVSFRESKAIEDIHNETLAYGDMTMLEYFHLSAQRQPLLETFLEPTESLSKNIVTKLQESAAAIAKTSGGVNNQASWYYRCVSRVIEWRDSSPEASLLAAGKVTDASRNAELCMNRPGTTRISLPGATIPPGDRKRYLDRECAESTGRFQNGCWTPLKHGVKAARVVTAQTRQEQKLEPANTTALLDEQKKWNDFLRDDFGIYRMSLLQLVSKLRRKESLSAPTMWRNQRKIVHVIYSRFMQQQGALLHLGRARMKLMKALCIPSISEQTNEDFLWIIRTDPELLPELKEDLVDALKDIPNAIVVASDFAVDGFSSGSFRQDGAMDEFKKESILLGNLSLLWSYHQASKSHTLIETNLDSDDGIALTFVENVQSHAKSLLYRDRKEDGWLQICISRHMEWHLYSPWERRSDKGCMLPGKGRSCIKSGLSWVTQPKSTPEFSKELHNLKEYVATCHVGNSTENSLYKGCWHQISQEDPENDVIAIRSMTPASTGLAKGTISSFDWSIRSLAFDKGAWSLLDPYFSIRPAEVKDVRKYLVENQEELDADNERSKCTHLRTCAGKWKNKHKVVHVILTDMQDPNLSDPWHRVSLSSLTRQSTYEFLWIIRVADFSDSRLSESLRAPMEESPLRNNIMIVKSSSFSFESFRSPHAIADVSKDSLIHGNMTMIQDYQKASQTRPLLETYLKATEGLARTYIDEIQVSVSTWAHEKSANGDDMWYFQCVPEYMETNYRTPHGEFVEDVFLRIIGRNESECIDRPGTTRVSLPGSKIEIGTNLKEVEQCSQGNNTTKYGCYISGDAPKPPAIRFRLPNEAQEPTSLSESDITALEKQQMRFVMQLRLQYSVFPPVLTNIRRLIADNERQIVHIVHTWIPDEESILTWRQFSIDTLLMQDNQNFLWIIRTNITDPEIIKGISYPIRFNYGDPENIFLVRSKRSAVGADFRKPEALADVNEETVVRGKIGHLRNQWKAAQGRTVIETYLRPTDSLSTGFVREIQSSVISDIQSNNRVGHQARVSDRTNEKESWYFHCVNEYLEWNFFAPQGVTPKAGFLFMQNTDTTCTSNPGVSRISLPGSEVTAEVNFLGTKRCVSKQNDGCFVQLTSSHVMTARAVIPLSVENQLSVVDNGGTKLPNQKELLAVMTKDFGMGPTGLEIMRTEMHKLKCSEVGGCFTRWESKYGVTHVIYTTLRDPLSIAVWRQFTFALEQQTNNKFLYIIRVVPDKDLLNEVIKPCIKTPLNIIVAKSTRDPSMLYDFRNPKAIADLNSNTIVTLNGEEPEMLKYYHESAQNTTLLETFLQPGDALRNTFAKDIQEFTLAHTKEKRSPSWYFQCSPTHWEWTYYTPDGHDMDHGSLEIVDRTRTNCMDRPGKTRITLPGLSFDSSFIGPANACDESSMENGCYLPMSFSGDGKQVPYGARAIVPDVLKAASSITHHRDDIVTANHIQRQMELFKQDFSVKPLPLKQMKQKIKTSMEKEFLSLEKKSKRQAP